MLPVGREINLREKDVACAECAWQGVGSELSTGLIRLNHSDIYVYAHRCPGCGSFNVASKAKLLEFRSLAGSTARDGCQQAERDGAAERQVAAKKPNRLWE